MRALGVMLFLAGMLGAGWTMKASFERSRPLDALLALAAPILLLAGVTGAVLALVPDFLR